MVATPQAATEPAAAEAEADAPAAQQSEAAKSEAPADAPTGKANGRTKAGKGKGKGKGKVKSKTKSTCKAKGQTGKGKGKAGKGTKALKGTQVTMALAMAPEAASANMQVEKTGHKLVLPFGVGSGAVEVTAYIFHWSRKHRPLAIRRRSWFALTFPR